MTTQDKITALKEMKITRLRRNLVKIITWDRGIKIYTLESLRDTIDYYNTRAYGKHSMFLSQVEKCELV
jgi:hypothetical protein